MTESGSTEPSVEHFADLDHNRTARRGYPEAVYCAGKTPEQIAMIAAAVRDQPHVTLFTRASKQAAAAILSELPSAFHDQQAGLLAWPPNPPAAAPVVALPTSVGYGAAFEGLAALLAMLNACAPGVAVVNIDNGYGAGHLAAQIAAP